MDTDPNHLDAPIVPNVTTHHAQQRDPNTIVLDCDVPVVNFTRDLFGVNGISIEQSQEMNVNVRVNKKIEHNHIILKSNHIAHCIDVERKYFVRIRNTQF